MNTLATTLQQQNGKHPGMNKKERPQLGREFARCPDGVKRYATITGYQVGYSRQAQVQKNDKTVSGFVTPNTKGVLIFIPYYHRKNANLFESNQNRIKSCDDFKSEEYNLVYSCSEEVHQELESVPETVLKGIRESITGVFTRISEGELVELWVCEGSRPYDIHTLFYRIL